jgi:hypothetical protein
MQTQHITKYSTLINATPEKAAHSESNWAALVDGLRMLVE